MHLGDLYVKILMFYPEFKVIHMDYVLAVIWVGKLRYIHDGKLNGATCFVKSWLASVYTNSPDLGLPAFFLDLECSPVSTLYMMPPVPIFHVSDLLLRLSHAYVYSLLLPLCGFLGLIFSVVVMSLVSSINQTILSVCPSCSPRKKFNSGHEQNTAYICSQKH